ncbi:S8 family serine peptidase [bacterium]|nr:S8 family serine peptidase [bacterium]
MFIVRNILITATLIAPFATYGATQKKCDDETYKKSHPYECRITNNYMIGAGIIGTAAIAAGGMAFAGGGSGGGGAGSAPAPTPTINTYNYVGADVTEAHLAAITTGAQYTQNQTQYDTIRLGYSLARGFTGKDVSIAVMDSDSWHGRTVTAIAAGPIAPDATVTRYAIADTENTFMSYAEIGNIIRNVDADIINASWNSQMRATDIKSSTQIAHLTHIYFIDGLKAAAERDAIFVWAAGNEGATQSGALSALPRVVPELNGHFINVVAWDDNTGALAEYSNACGTTMQYCITAPGTDINANGRNVSGTSFAAPMVSAAIATIKQAFPYMTAPQITDLLLTTARDIGTPGVDATYGHGMLDLERATRPVGTPLVPLKGGGNAQLQTARVSGTIGKKINNTGLKLAFIDDYGRAFQTDLRKHIKISNYSRGYEMLRHPNKRSASAGPIEFGFRHSEFLAADGWLETDAHNTITFIAVNKEFYIPHNSKIFIRPEVGSAHPRGRTDSIITKFSNIYTANMSVGINRGDWTFGVTVPDMILDGNMYMNIPQGRDENGDIIFKNIKTSLTGDAPIEYSVSYKYITAAFVDNPIGTDEFFILARRAIAF